MAVCYPEQPLSLGHRENARTGEVIVSRSSTMRTAVACATAVLGLTIGVAPSATADTTDFRISQLSTAPGYDWLSQVVATGPKKAWAFGETLSGQAPTARRWNGTAWKTVALPSGLTRGITIAEASGPKNVWAFGGGDEAGDAYALRWNGSTWSVAQRWPDGEMLSDAAVLGRNDVWVFGNSHIGPGVGTWHYNGSTWTQVDTGDIGIRKASAVAPDDIWAVGTNDTGEADDLVSHWNGTTWNAVEIPVLPAGHTTQLNGIYAASSQDVWIVGDESHQAGDDATYTPLALHFDGTTWQRVDPPAADATILTDVSPDGRGGLWVIPETFEPYQAPELLGFSGGQWSTVRPERPDGQTVWIHDVASVPRSGATWAVGEAFPPDRRTSDAAIWVNGSLPR